MGMQNSLVTRLSGAVVRTTHLTGVVTDLGIEAARWYRWHRAKLRALPTLLPSRSTPDRPEPSLTALSTHASAVARAGPILVLTKANARSTVHRPAPLDYVGVTRFDESGHDLLGEAVDRLRLERFEQRHLAQDLTHGQSLRAASSAPR